MEIDTKKVIAEAVALFAALKNAGHRPEKICPTLRQCYETATENPRMAEALGRISLADLR